jgi:hypothetical protein
MRVKVTERAIVQATPSCNVVYPPGEHLAPRAHIEQIEKQGKGERLPEKDDAASGRAGPERAENDAPTLAPKLGTLGQ